jgi:S-adenosylmethionine hydrolase
MNSMSRIPPIALLTDFGHRDPFVGIMKGVIAKIAPRAPLIDITHNIPTGDIQRAAVMLWQSKSFFPAGTIFLSVVDPGVGTHRRGMILQSEDHLFVGPDNGLFSFIFEKQFEAWELLEPVFQLPQPGTTFHGRDIFAPAAAHAANGIEGTQFGPSITEIIQLRGPRLHVKSNQIEGEILYNDQFGNLLTSLGKWISLDREKFLFDPWLNLGTSLSEDVSIAKNQASLMLPDGHILPWVDTFADIPDGDCGMLVGSSGLVEIAAYRSRAADILKLSSGDPVTLLY